MKHISLPFFGSSCTLVIYLLSIAIQLMICENTMNNHEDGTEYDDYINIDGTNYPVKDNSLQMVLKREDCENKRYKFEDLKNKVDGYNVSMTLDSSNECDNGAIIQGFECRVTFISNDRYTSLGKQICIDVLDVPGSIRNRSQLRIKASDSNGETIGREIYGVTILRPSSQPYLMCTDKQLLSVAVLVRPIVDICTRGKYYGRLPHVSIMDSLVNNSVYMGAVSLQEKENVGIYTLFKRCHETLTINERYYLIKVDTTKITRMRCSVRAKHPSVNFSRNKGCLQLLHLSSHYKCDIIVSLYQNTGSSLNISMPYGSSPVRAHAMPQCTVFNPSEGDIYLKVTKTSSDCLGRFVVSVNISRLSQNMGDSELETASSSLRHLYMAVFISLIAVCLLILGLTCVCCLRMRSNRARQLARRQLALARRAAQQTEDNAGFQTSSSDFSISWDPDNPEQLSGLPTYEDVLAISSGINPSFDTKPDLPPDYTSLYGSDT